MASMPENEANEKENFRDFFIKWKNEQNNQLQDLITASETSNPPLMDSSLCNLVGRVMGHYEEYYRVKSNRAKTEVLVILSPPWNTPLEDAYLWVGGWRPTTAFHLLYSKFGLQFEAQLSDLVMSLEAGDLGNLSSGQLERIDKLQRSTIQEERDITEKMAKQQERVADMEMVELSHDASGSTRMDHERVGSTLKPKEEGFRRILQSADNLRMTTLKAVINILSPIQAVHFLIAAAELHLRIHNWGKEKEVSHAGSAYPTTGEAS
ncbi:hypothetical protein BUALT_Bualt01G0011900 [Buddleja alternifolia]|uniref:DOG1 domain-containing protein n=1 Tax=Buddleja alternifolia TaxID=168488 RepID=A0AAV6Y5R7_9LAMI|nr:hypothetical protein BUALT_Bualt01G0011900 [Buddleja alternifolia]